VGRLRLGGPPKLPTLVDSLVINGDQSVRQLRAVRGQRYRIALETIRALRVRHVSSGARPAVTLGSALYRIGAGYHVLSLQAPSPLSTTECSQVPRRRILVGRVRARREWSVGKAP
jgi:hypothetical protein